LSGGLPGLLPMQIHIDRGGQRFGPYSLEDVNRYLADGTLLPSDLGWHDGAADWIPLPKISGVNVGGGAPPSGAPPAPTAANAAKPKAPAAAAKKGGGKGLKIALGVVGGLAVIGGIVFGVLHFLKKDGDNAGGDANGTDKTSSGWQSLPDGAHIVGGADVIVQLKLGAIFSSPLVQQQLQKDPNSGMIINMMQQSTGIGPGDLQDLTLSISGLTAVAQSVDDPDALEQAMQSGFKSGALKIGAVLRTSKPFDVAKAETLMTSEDAKSEITEKTHAEKKYYLIKKDPGAPAAAALYIADDKTIVGGTESTIQSHIDNADKISARSGLDFIDPKQQILIAYAPPDASALGALVTKAMANMPADAPPPVKALGESLKKMEAAALSGGMAGGGLQLSASANFSDDASAKSFADNFNKTLALARQDQNVAQALLMAQGLGVQIPSAQSTDKQAKLTLSMPLQAIDAIASMAGGGREPVVNTHSQPTVQRWAGLTQMSNLPQWPNYKVVVKALGQPSYQTQNAVVLDLQKLMQTKTGTFNVKLLTSQEKQQYRLTGIRVDYYDDPQGHRAIRLYFRQQTQQLIGIEWYESGPRKIGPPKVNQQNRPGGGGRPTGGIRPGGGGRPGGGRPGGKSNVGERPGGFGTKGGATKGFPPRGAGIRPQPPSTTTVATAIAPPQSVAEAQQRLKGNWISTTPGRSKVTISFGNNNQFATDAGSGPKRGNYRILSVSGNRITFWGLRAANIATLTLNGANEFSVQQTSMVGVVPKGTFRK